MPKVPTDNPCAGCALCCVKLSGLKVSESEHSRCFSECGDQIEVESRSPFSVVYAKAGAGGCPNFDDGCQVYDDRPIECRLFPWTIGAAGTLLGRPFITLHAKTECPAKSELIAPYSEAKEMATAWARDAFGDRPPIIIREGWLYRIADGVRGVLRKILRRG